MQNYDSDLERLLAFISRIGVSPKNVQFHGEHDYIFLHIKDMSPENFTEEQLNSFEEEFGILVEYDTFYMFA